MDLEFREATPADAPAVREVARASLHASYEDLLGGATVDTAHENWYDDGLRDELRAEDLLFVVAEADDEVVAFAHVHLREDEGRVQWLHVHPDHRGGGVGSRLLERTRNVLASRGVGRVSGEVLADNVAGNEFYREHGFVLRDQYAVEVGGRLVAENVYDEAGAAAVDLEPVDAGATELYVDMSDEHRGRSGSWYPVYRSADGSRRYGWYCAACDSVDNAMDSMGRVVCNDCENARKPERWDAAYL